MVETILFSTDQFIFTYICTGVIFGMNKTLTEAPYWIQSCRERMEHTKLYYTLCYWYDEHNQYICTKWLQYVEVNMATISKQYNILLFNTISA